MLREPLAAPLLPGGIKGRSIASLQHTLFLGLIACVCIAIGVLHPLATDATKDARLTTCAVRGPLRQVVCTEGAERPRSMPFYPLTLTLASQVASVVLTSAIALFTLDRADAKKRLLNMRALWTMWPLGAIYGWGDFCQTIACSQASGTMVVIVGQCKLLITAAFSRALLKRRKQRGVEQWSKLFIICAAAACSAHLRVQGTATAMERLGEVRGASLALVKAASSALGAVISEKYFKENADESFWVMSTRVQAMMFVMSFTLFIRDYANGDLPGSLGDLFFSAPFPQCDFSVRRDGWCDPFESPSGECQCLDRIGWDWFTVVAMLAIGANGMVTGLTLRYLSAVGKSICNVLGLVVFYFLYVGCGFQSFELRQLFLIYIIVATSYAYTVGKHQK